MRGPRTTGRSQQPEKKKKSLRKDEEGKLDRNGFEHKKRWIVARDTAEALQKAAKELGVAEGEIIQIGRASCRERV